MFLICPTGQGDGGGAGIQATGIQLLFPLSQQHAAGANHLCLFHAFNLSAVCRRIHPQSLQQTLNLSSCHFKFISSSVWELFQCQCKDMCSEQSSPEHPPSQVHSCISVLSSFNRLEVGGKYFSFQCVFLYFVYFVASCSGLFCYCIPMHLGCSSLEEFRVVLGSQQIHKRSWGRSSTRTCSGDQNDYRCSSLQSSMSASLEVQPVQSGIAFQSSQTQESHCPISGFFIVP